MVYKWKFQPKGNVSAQETGKELERILKEHKGRLTALDVVNCSRKPKSVLYNCFEWDDEIAAEKYREEQARYIIRNLVVEESREDSDEKVQVRGFVSIDDEELFYTTIKTAMEDEDMRQYVLLKALKDLKDWQRRYKDLKEFSQIFSLIETLKI